ncbi:MAG: replication-associated recombination protein A [Puniceicoccaceae bacterium]|nr:MAG: replication-associated recombination protein A [Puniceicoccaceae bacterium]
MPSDPQPEFNLGDEPPPAAGGSQPPAAPAPGAADSRPLAARMRPRTLAEVVGQDHLLQPGSLLPRLIAADRFGSLIFFGPPGSGKTSLAEAIAGETSSRFVRVNAVLSNVAELRDILAYARRRPQDRTILFIDEIHRFNKSQQDLLLPDVEAGHIRLIGATTHNPGFYVNPPLLSRSHLFRLDPLSPDSVARVLRRALDDPERGLGERRCQVEDSVLLDLARLCDGDLRRALNALEVLVLGQPEGGVVTTGELRVFAQERRIRYDADEDEHYDTISAFIKSIRGGDPDAALYWLAKMLAGGEDPRFIARRLVILASEDIGLADSSALPLAVAAHHACDFVGLPECRINLAHATVRLALAPKSNTAYAGLGEAEKALRENPVQSVPMHLRDKGGQASKRLGHGEGYRYSHDFPEAISGQDYLELPLQFYHPGTAGAEAALAERLARWKALKAARQEAEAKPPQTRRRQQS